MCITRRSLLLASMPGFAAAQARPLTLAAASDLRYALDELLTGLRLPGGRRTEVVYGSSGKLSTQILQGAPFDVFLSADRRLAAAVHAGGEATAPPRAYALGFLAQWSLDPGLGSLPLAEALPKARRIAIANPAHAPYGQRAEQVLRRLGQWEALRPRLVLGENIAQAAQFVASGAAELGLVALSLVMAPQLAGRGRWQRVPPDWHEPLEQTLVITRRAAADPDAQAFVERLLVQGELLRRYGFEPIR
jgi:molybdate transport system substrate-binding protein